MENNVIFDSNRGIAFAATGGLPHSVENAIISGNIIYDIGHSPTGNVEYADYFHTSKNVTFENNIIIGVNKQSRWFAHNNDEQGMSVSCNVIINSHEMTGYRQWGTTVENNTYYNTTLQDPGDGISYSNASDANMVDLTFITDTYTNRPRNITLPGVVTTATSPHADGCFGTYLGKAGFPNPNNGSTNISTTAGLSWLPGNAANYDVYFGKDNPPAFVLNQTGANYEPDTLENGTTYYWRIDAKSDSETAEGMIWSFETVAADSVVTSLSPEAKFFQGSFYINNYPNPFNSVTNICFDLPEEGHVAVKIYNARGEELEETANAIYPAGSHSIVWDAHQVYGNKVPSGQYFHQIKFKNQVKINKMLLMKK